jgi:ribonuclease-3
MLRRFFDRLRLPFRKDRELRSALFRILGFYPQNIDYYKIAFAHKSQALRDKNGKPLNNERLEFLGDAVLESVVSDILFHHFEKRHEGFLTATRSKIVQRESLNRLAKEMGIDQFIQTASRNHSGHSHLGGNAFEALMGAIYLDKGYKTCQKFVKKQILGRLMDLDGVANKEVNFKSKLLEWCQKNKLKQDFVMRLEDNGKQKEPVFHCTVIVESIEFGYGKGFSKKEAQQQAARETLTMLRRDENVVDSVFRSKEKRTAMEANEMAVLPKIDEIEDDLLREQQQAKRPQPAEPRKAERKESDNWNPCAGVVQKGCRVDEVGV